MIKEIVVFESNGIRFNTKDEAERYESICDDLSEIVKIEDKGEAMIKLMILFSKEVSHLFDDLIADYTELFKNHLPCAYSCSLWRVFTEMCGNKFPAIYTAYYNIMSDYVEQYGEK